MESVERYKGLVIAHNPLSRHTNNGKTYASLLSEFSKEQLCQIYATNLQPDFQVADSFYRVHERAVIRNKRTRIGGEVFEDIAAGQAIAAPVKNKPLVRKIKKIIQKLTYTRMGQAVRSWLWGNEPLLNDDLRNWIEKEKPDFVFWGNGNVNAMVKLALQICEEYNLPLIANLGDDYFSRGYSANIFYNIYQRKLKSLFAQIAKKAEVIVVCSEKMRQVLQEQFGGNYFVAMNSIDRNEVYETGTVDKKNLTMIYTGNVGIGRWKTLAQVGKALSELSGKYNVQLDVYSGEDLENKIIKSFSKLNCVKLHGAVYGEKLQEVRENADIMLFAETFDRKHKKLLETAVSTKVPEYMNTKRAILAVGPDYSAAIDYYKRYDVAEVVSCLNKKQIAVALENIVNNDVKRLERINRGYELVEKEHLAEVNAGKVKEYIEKGIEKKRIG